MKKTATLATLAMGLLLYSAASFPTDVKSLRGDAIDTEAKAPERMEVMNIKGGIERSYKQQPPMVPHEVDKYAINLKVNGCLACHSETTYEERKAPKVSDSHYTTRDGKLLSHIASRRYFCTQCHASQMGAAPLVQNNFQGAK